MISEARMGSLMEGMGPRGLALLLEGGVRPRECVPEPRKRPDRPTDQHVDLCFEQRLRRRVLAACPELVQVDLPHLVASLPCCRLTRGFEGLLASLPAVTLGGALSFPLFPRAGPRVIY